MSSSVERDLARARIRLRAAWQRWHDAQSRAENYQRRAESGPVALRAVYAERAQVQLRAAAVHRASARLQEAYVARLEESSEHPRTAAARPMFMREVAGAVDAASAAVSVYGRSRLAAAGVASDVLASSFQDAELVMGEGPSLDAMTAGVAVAAGRGALSERWPRLALVVTGMGVLTVAAVPMRYRATRMGALTVVNPRWSATNGGLGSLQTVADWVAETVVDELEPETDEAAGTLLAPLLRDERLGRLHQAAGRVAAELNCDVDTALALIRARSFAESIELGVLVDDIAAGRRGLDD